MRWMTFNVIEVFQRLAMSASTEAYFAFLDTQWREVAVKHPKLTPNLVNIHNIVPKI